jgi:[ribosomal protein S5]-alanine N-acetyltransferase
MNLILETERLRLRELEEQDFSFYAGLFSNPLVMRFYPKLYSARESRRSFERQLFNYRLNGSGLWLIETKQGSARAGVLGLLNQVVDFKVEREIGYLLHPDFWKHGYATECGIAVRDYAFSTRNLPYVISLIRPVNLASQTVARRLGMQISRRTIYANLEHFVFRVDR